MNASPTNIFFNRDLSWLLFNQRLLDEAADSSVPLLERIKFLGIYSSNLDEFYRVRMPVLLALHKLNKKTKSIAAETPIVKQASEIIAKQQQQFGNVLTTQLIPALKENDIHLVYNEPLSTDLLQRLSAYFFEEVLAYLQPKKISTFYPENNKLYFLILLQHAGGEEEVMALNIPSDEVSRFFNLSVGTGQTVVFIDDVIKAHLPALFMGKDIKGCYAFKITREAELDLKADYPGDIAEQIEKQLQKRDYGHATRFLYQPGLPLRVLEVLADKFGLPYSSLVEGGHYHNLKDLLSFPVKVPRLLDDVWPPIPYPINTGKSIFEELDEHDLLINPPYNDYGTILRFFSEAATNESVEEIYVSLYRVARDSKIVHSLISAAKNGKKVSVMVELKARFDEENNLKWAKKLKRAGARIIYSPAALKVHAKVALVKCRKGYRNKYYGLLGTGNFNESTAKLYTDHILATANKAILREVEILFLFLLTRDKPQLHPDVGFNQLLVSKFNLQERFIALIDREIAFAEQGLPAAITIKLNNIEEHKLIERLYRASQAGVKIKMLIRGICCLIPEKEGLSENITVVRIVDRYLEHGRVFIFGNNGNPDIYLGSADWMNRNVYRRIEVCFPVYDERLKQQLADIINLQLSDNTKAVLINSNLENVPVKSGEAKIQSQRAIYNSLIMKKAL